MTEEQAKDFARAAAAEYVKVQNDRTRDRLWDALRALGEFDPPVETWEGSSPSRRFILSLLPRHLLWPDPLLGDSIIDCEETRYPKLTDDESASEHQRQADQLGRDMLESIKKLPPVH